MEDRWTKTPDLPLVEKQKSAGPCTVNATSSSPQRVVTVMPTQVCRARLMTRLPLLRDKGASTDIEMFSCQSPQKTKHYGCEDFHIRPGYDSGPLSNFACFSFRR